ncbi:MAG TPA: oligopeptidase B, partial [Luteimicrobium sp.]|nr:oligopeptidase B [Luteimicrobium sp.]
MSDVSEPTAPATPDTPRAEKRPTTRTHHGDAFVDDYEWLRDKTNPEVIAYLEAENAYTQDATAHLAPLRKRLFDEIRSRTQETDLSVPVREGGFWYVTRTVEGKQYPVHVRVPVADEDDWTPPALPDDGSALPGEQLLLDQNVEAEGHEFFSLGSFDVTADGTRALYAVDTDGDERFTLRIRDLATGEDLADEIPGTFPGAFFTPDGEHLFYTTVDEAWRPDTLWRHRVGTPVEDDVKVFHEPDERFWLGAGLTRSRRYVVIEMGSKITSEVWLLDADDVTGEPRVVWPRREGVEYSVEHVQLRPDARSDEERAERSAVAARAAAGELAGWAYDLQDVLLVLHNGGSGEAPENFELALSKVPT